MQGVAQTDCCTGAMDDDSNLNANLNLNTNLNLNAFATNEDGNLAAIECAIVCLRLDGSTYIGGMASKLALDGLDLGELAALHYCGENEATLGFNCEDQCIDLLDCIPPRN